MIFGSDNRDQKQLAATIGINPFVMKDYIQASKLYTISGIEKAILLLHNYNLKSIGINDAGTEDASLLKEMVAKMVNSE